MKTALVLVWLVVVTNVASQKDGDEDPGDDPSWKKCTFDYEPCTCNDDGNGPQVVCDNVPTDAIRYAFGMTPVRDHLRLTLIGNISRLPTDLLAGKRAKYLDWYLDTADQPLQVHVDAFRSSQDWTTGLSTYGCDLSAVDWTCLANFTALTSIRHAYASQPNMQLTPHLPRLELIELEGCQDVGDWYAPSRTPSLKTIDLSNVNVSSPQVLDRILDSLTAYGGTLQELSLKMVNLDRVPVQVASLTRLRSLNLFGNFISALGPGSLVAAAGNQLLRLDENRIREIDPTAFSGDWSQTRIHLGNNQLVSFPESVFRSLLESMTRGSIDITGNPIKCDCSMAWLLRDQRQLLSKVRGGFCAGDLQLPFESTDDHNFTGCPLPCRLQHDGDQYDIICDNVSHEQVRSAFLRSPVANHRRLQLTMSAEAAPLDADVTAGKTVQHVVVDCPTGSTLSAIDGQAFQSTAAQTVRFEVSGCDASAADFRFLAALPMLRRLALIDLGLHSVPQAIGDLKKLQYLDLSNNSISRLEPAILPGDANVDIKLNFNRLTTLDEMVFGGLLRSMTNGSIEIEGDERSNRIICDCSAAWLQVNQTLLDRLRGGRCSDGRRLDEFPGVDFKMCHRPSNGAVHRTSILMTTVAWLIVFSSNLRLN